MRILSLDHLVLTVADPDRTVAFYHGILGMEETVFGGGRRALSFGSQKINLHTAGAEFQPAAHKPTPGSGDLCFLVESPTLRSSVIWSTFFRFPNFVEQKS